MNKSAIAAILLIGGGLTGLAPAIATGETQNSTGQAQSAQNIGDNDSAYVDGKSFQVIPGKAKGDAAAQIKNLGARDLGPAAIIFRSGNKLYIADAQSEMAGAQALAAVPGRNYAYDPQAVRPSLSGGGSAGYNQNAATNYAYDPQAVRPSLSGGGSAGYNQNTATNYAYDPQAVRPSLSGGGSAGYNQNAATNYAYDPQAVRPSLSGGGSAGYNQNAATNYAYDPQQGYPIRNPNPWANNYAYDPARVAAGQPSIIYDSDYVEYRLKKAFEENWTPAGTK
jgi:hypothetical protein